MVKCTYLKTHKVGLYYYATWHVTGGSGAEGYSQVLVDSATNEGAPDSETVNIIKNMIKKEG